MKDLTLIEEYRDQIRQQELYVQELRSLIDGVKAVSYDKEAVQSSGSSDPMLECFIKIEQAEEKLKVLKGRYVRHCMNVIDKIKRIPRTDYQKFLYLIYIDDLTISQASEKMKWSYEYGKKQHTRALKEYQSCPHDVP